MSQDVLRHLPSVGQLLEHPRIAPLLVDGRREWVTRVVQDAVDAERERLRAGEGAAGGDRESLTRSLTDRILARHDRLTRPAMTRVINATGVVVHTNLGRSCYPEQAVARMALAARRNCDLEMDLEAGRRGHRGRRVEAKLALLTGGEDALIVNNNAAALWLAVRTLARGAKVILSRGEVVAIGGSFRLHEIIEETGCRLVEVGTTNRTSLKDYENALEPGAVVLKVHRSNFVLDGFTEETSLAELGELCARRGNTLIYDAGSGLLESPARWGLPSQLTVSEDLAAGAHVITCSGDKLFGGGQAGMIIGRADLVAAMRGHTMRRAFRVDKTTLAAVDGVLDHYLAGDHLAHVPTLRFLERTEDDLQAAAERLGETLAPHLPDGWSWEVTASESQVGGGAGADSILPGRMVLLRAPTQELERCHLALRCGDPAVVARISQAGLGLDTRALDDDEHDDLVTALRRAWSPQGGPFGEEAER
ncbi:MAG TPA: L-seryl-tRNA(Sec) selenium transferase [Candidatus Krumholzibacteria bacterium]|nr:L-seryl-tRNA(Sec) selenium transferase [Candidatus Krumholzibacteria bacterium]HRX50074.1 L-seryl-tRNA(Sec) selenium transferase [Candidatus Krumholzibacteria bacterium]